MRARGRALFVALLSVVAASTIPASGEAKRVEFVQVPVATEEHLPFFRLSWPSTRVVARKVIQDNQGFLWLGAADGLRRYDGYSFMRVPEEEERNSVGFINAESLMKDHSGAFWFGIDGYLARYDPARGQLRRYRTVGGPGCPRAELRRASDHRRPGRIHMAGHDGRAGPHWTRTTSKLIYYQHRSDDDSTLASNRVISTLEARDGQLWVATNEALDAFDRRSGRVTRRIRFEAESAPACDSVWVSGESRLRGPGGDALELGCIPAATWPPLTRKTPGVTVYSFRLARRPGRTYALLPMSYRSQKIGRRRFGLEPRDWGCLSSNAASGVQSGTRAIQTTQTA